MYTIIYHLYKCILTVIYKYYINKKYNAFALNIRMLLVKTPGCCYPKHPDVVRTKIYTFAYL